jgi:glutamate dehydrogenase/leucine dehydrogenase
VDILLPASRTRAISNTLARDVKARAVVPIANAPYDAGSLQVLQENEVLCLPGYLANCGGVLASSLYDSGVSRSEVEELMAVRFRRTIAALLARTRQLGLPAAGATETMATSEANRRARTSMDSHLSEKILRRLEPRLPRRWKAHRARSRCLAGLDALDHDIAALGAS